MSSETSTDALQPWQLFTLAGLVGATIVVFLSRGQTPAAVILLSVTIFTAAAVGVAAWRTFAPISSPDEPTSVPIVGGRTRAALEREKALVLRTIKELEFDRSMGKVSDKDFADLSARLRQRAAGLIQQLDAAGGYRQQIEQEVAKRLRGPRASAPQQHGSAPQPQWSSPTEHVCGACSTANPPDARFCKQCGKALAA